MVAWGAAALQFWLLTCSAHEGMAALLRSSWLLLRSPWKCSTGQRQRQPPPFLHPRCSESVRLTLALYSMSVVLTKLMSFSAEAPQPTAANADQGACAKKAVLAGAPANRPPLVNQRG